MAIPNKRTELDDEIIFGVDTKHRTLSFGSPLTNTESPDDVGEINQLSVEMAVRAIRRMERDHPKKPITLFFNSNGGDVYGMLYLIDVILSSTCQFKFVGGGAILSAATGVMAVCDERFLYPNTTLMIHPVKADDVGGSSKDIDIEANELTRLTDRLCKIYADNSRMEKKFYEEICSRNLFLFADEAVSLGLADGIITYKKRGNLRQKRLLAMSLAPSTKQMKTLVKRLFDRINMKISVKDFNINLPAADEADPEITVDLTPVPDVVNDDESINLDDLLKKE